MVIVDVSVDVREFCDKEKTRCTLWRLFATEAETRTALLHSGKNENGPPFKFTFTSVATN
jgi:hypothetical protein